MRIAVIPAHNESTTIVDVVARTVKVVDRVLVIDDGSQDGTGELARKAGAQVHRQEPNRGKGEALRHGLELALEQGGTQIVTLDADGEHLPEDVPGLLMALAEVDVALGARRVYRSGARKAVNRLALFWFQLLDPNLEDTICGLRAFRAEAVPVVQNTAGGFAYEHEALLRAVRGKLRIASIPVQTNSRQGSQVTWDEILRANNHFDCWVLEHMPELPLALWRKVLLYLGCLLGLLVGVPAREVTSRWKSKPKMLP